MIQVSAKTGKNCTHENANKTWQTLVYHNSPVNGTKKFYGKLATYG